MPGGGTGVLNTAAHDIMAQFNAQGAAIQQQLQEFLATRTAVQVRYLPLVFQFMQSSMGVRQRTRWV